MTRDEIVQIAWDVGLFMRSHKFQDEPTKLEQFAERIAAEKEQQMIRDGWRQCAEGQRTTQYCRLLDAAVKSEREACAKACEDYTDRYAGCEDEGHGYEIAAAVRARGET